MDFYIKLIYSLIIVVILAIITKKKELLDNIGVLCSSIMAFIILIGANIYWLILLVCFLLFGSLVSKIGYSKKAKIGMGESKRTVKNVLANGSIAVLMVILYCLGIIDYTTALFGYVGSIAAATSDTFSSELGMLSNETPRLITTFQKVERGVDGGVSLWGTLAGLFGAFVIGFISYLLFGLNSGHISPIIFIGTISGLLGNLADSLFGALFERKGIFTNEYVNLTCTIVGCISAIVLINIL
jgi:uncharacterized protein (TIGR00297 family)